MKGCARLQGRASEQGDGQGTPRCQHSDLHHAAAQAEQINWSEDDALSNSTGRSTATSAIQRCSKGSSRAAVTKTPNSQDKPNDNGGFLNRERCRADRPAALAAGWGEARIGELSARRGGRAKAAPRSRAAARVHPPPLEGTRQDH
jgi:hypothetical protein